MEGWHDSLEETLVCSLRKVVGVSFEKGLLGLGMDSSGGDDLSREET